MGDGKIRIGNDYAAPREITFRWPDGGYNKEGIRAISEIYGASAASGEGMALRLIELLDYLEDHFGGRGIKIISGYRGPDENRSLQTKGKLAASSSLHMDGEAADITMRGVPSAEIYDYLIPENCCGAGYYHGKAIHIDTGPPRFWDEKTSGTEKKEPPENEHIIIETLADIHKADDQLGLKFLRVTDYPIGVVRTMDIVCKDGKHTVKKRIQPVFQTTVKTPSRNCYTIKNIEEGKNIVAATPTLPASKCPFECRIMATFCEPKTSKMPASVESNRFIINPY